MNKVVDIKTAIDKIRSGDSIMLGGFTNFGCPLHLLYELAKRPQVNNLTLISEDLGYGGLPYLQGPGRLFENEQVSKSITSYRSKSRCESLDLRKKIKCGVSSPGNLDRTYTGRWSWHWRLLHTYRSRDCGRRRKRNENDQW